MPSNQLMYSNTSLANKQHAFITNAVSVCRDIFTAEAHGLPYIFLNRYLSNLHGGSIVNGVRGVAVGVLIALTIFISTHYGCKVYNAGTEGMNTLHQLELPAPKPKPRPDNLRSVDVAPSNTTFNLPVESRGNHSHPSQKGCSMILGIMLGSLHKQVLAMQRQQWLWNTPTSVASTALIFSGLSYLPRVAAQTDSPAFRINLNSSLPTGVVTLVGILALGFNAWLQGGIDTAPQVVRATRYIFSLKNLSGLGIDLASDSSNTYLTISSFSHKHLTSFILDTAQRGLFHRKYCALVGTKGVQEIPRDMLPSKKLGCPATGCRSTEKCRNISSVTKLPLPTVARYKVLTPDAQSVALLEGMASYYDKLRPMPLFLVHGCIFPLRSLVHLPLRFWINPEVLAEDEFTELIALHIRCPMDCFSTLRQWFSGADVWDWVTTIEASDASYTVARALQCKDRFRFEQHDPTIPWPSKDGSTCALCEGAARKDRATASRAMFKVAFWFTQYAFYHEALYHDGVVMRGEKNDTAADVVLEILNNQAATMQRTNAAVFSQLSRRGTFLEFPTYPLSIEHAASIAEIVAAFILSMVADPGIWVAATVARQITVRVLVSESGRGLPLAQRWSWCCFGRFPIFDAPRTQGIAVWGYSRYNSLGAVLYGWLAIAAALAGTGLRSQAAQLQWCTNFGIHLWVGWVAYGAVVLVVLVSLVLSLLGPSERNEHNARAGPLAAEVSLLKFTPWKVARLFGMAFAIVSGALVLLYPSIRWLGYLPEVASMILWFGSEEYTYSAGYTGSATAVAIFASGLGGISRGFQLKVPFSCLTVVG
ncbi:hypothetical protein BYT27DRAFT_7332763 [Phlegmacium glaucopus]|nr:hypothetical protein BYT27DRAFT_7332763 [Phlegmacium glaucopus]